MLGMRAWWYFDSTSFPYQLLWRFSLSIFLMCGERRDLGRHKKRPGAACGIAKKKQVFPVFSFLCMYFPGVWSVMCVLCV
jgi:hypothetical protein